MFNIEIISYPLALFKRDCHIFNKMTIAIKIIYPTVYAITLQFGKKTLILKRTTCFPKLLTFESLVLAGSYITLLFDLPYKRSSPVGAQLHKTMSSKVFSQSLHNSYNWPVLETPAYYPSLGNNSYYSLRCNIIH